MWKKVQECGVRVAFTGYLLALTILWEHPEVELFIRKNLPSQTSSPSGCQQPLLLSESEVRQILEAHRRDTTLQD